MSQGPLTATDLAAIWKSSVDRSYHEPIIRAGEGRGYEVYTQYFTQLARVAQAIDVTTQAMFIRPYSGQTNDSAKGGQKATVALTFSRTKMIDRPLVLEKGKVFIEEEVNDFSPDGSEAVRTGRRYTLTHTLVFLPGDIGPFTVNAEAENIGWGFNNPQPGSLKVVSQLGSFFYHDRATLTLRTALPVAPATPSTFIQTMLATVNEADTFIPEHVGQYIAFTAGANAGKIGRIVSFFPPDSSVPIGSTVQIEVLGTLDSFTHAGTFLAGETVTFDSGGPVQAFGTFIAEIKVGARKRVAFVITSGNPFVTTTMRGLTSGATEIVEGGQPVGGGSGNTFYTVEAPSGGVGGASWRILDWVVDWGLSVTNTLSPTGGRHAMLDMLGEERNLPRTAGETDDQYSERMSHIADVVTPNAIKRTLNRTIGVYPWCFREVGTAKWPGFFFDGDSITPPTHDSGSGDAIDVRHASECDAYDSDVLLWTGTLASSPTTGNIASGAASVTVVNGTLLGTARYVLIDSEIIGVVTRVANVLTITRGLWGTTPAFHFAGASVRTVFEPGERVDYTDSTGNVLASGFFGTPPVYTGLLTLFTMIRKAGVGAWSAGNIVVGRNSRAHFNTTANTDVSATVNARRFRTYLGFPDFRGYFWVGLPRVNFGEFGFAYDSGPADAYDVGVMDGFPTGNADFYRRVFNAIDRVKAGGVGWEPYIESIGCP